MKKSIIIAFLGLLFLSLTAFNVHKFYMGMYQVNYAPEKKTLEITSRIFIDDLNKAIEKKYHKKVSLSAEKENPEDLILLQKYISSHFSIKVNEQSQTMNFLSKEMEGDVLICYWKIKDVKEIKSLQIYNAVLTDWNSEQQNIVHLNVLGKKNSFLFTDSSTNNVLKY
jgi:hypothetical protein